jgi:hypothetical protein
MNTTLLAAVEQHRVRGEVALAFAKKYAHRMPTIFGTLYTDTMQYHVPITVLDNPAEVRRVCSNLFGDEDWMKEAVGNRVNWTKVVDGVNVTIIGAESPRHSTLTAVPREAFAA